MAATWVLPRRSRVRPPRPLDPEPLSIRCEVHVRLHRNPIPAGAENGGGRKRYLENAGIIHVRLGDRAVNLRPREGADILIKKDVEVIRRARSIAVRARRIHFGNAPNLSCRNDEIVSSKVAKGGSIRSLLRTRCGGSRIIQLIIENGGGNYRHWQNLKRGNAKRADDFRGKS